MKNAFQFLTILLCLLLFGSCEEEEPSPPDDTITSFSDGIFISCEGAFGQGNAAVYFLDPEKSQYVPEIYNNVNQKPVGDVLQSIGLEDDKAYLVVNNSGKIIQVNVNDFIETGTIEGLSAPTTIEIENGKGYIGSLYSQHILVADINSLTVTDSIFLGEQSNEVLEEDNKLWVLSQSEYQGRIKDHIYFIKLSDRSIDSLKVGSNPVQWTLGGDDQLYVYCQGAESADGPAIYKINISSQSVDQKTEIDAPVGLFSKLAYDENNNRILVQLTDGIYTYQIGSGELSDSPLMDLANIEFLYGLGVSPENGDIYIGDAKDFSSAGSVYIFTSDGQAKGNLQVGIAPNHFYFD